MSKIQIRRNTAAAAAASNPVLAAGELGLETDTGVIRIGDGTTAWNSLGDAREVLTKAKGNSTYGRGDVSVAQYGADATGAADATAAIQSALDSGARTVAVPKGLYLVSSTLVIPQYTTLLVMPGATIRATAAMTALVSTPATTLMRFAGVKGGGVLDCNEKAERGVWPRYSVGFAITDITIIGATKRAIMLGDTAAPGRSAETVIHAVELLRNAPNAIPADSYGIYIENSGDHQVSQVRIRNYRFGVFVPSGASSEFEQVHVWAEPASGFVHTCFYDLGGSGWVNCVADTPDTYGFRVGGFNTTIIGGKVFNNPAYGSDNVIRGVKFDQDDPFASVIGVQFVGGSTKRIAVDVEAGPTGTLHTVTIVSGGATNVVVNNSTQGRMVGLKVRDLIFRDFGTLPTASSAYRDQVALVAGSAGAADTLWMCVKEADDTYKWRQLDMGVAVGGRVEVDLLAQEQAHTTWGSVAQTANAFFGGYRSTSAQSSSVSFKFRAPAGTYTLDLFGFKSTAAAIVTVNIDGTDVATLDEYAASGGGAKMTATGIAITSGGWHTITFSNPTKNASSSGYNAYLSRAVLTRTA